MLPIVVVPALVALSSMTACSRVQSGLEGFVRPQEPPPKTTVRFIL